MNDMKNLLAMAMMKQGTAGLDPNMMASMYNAGKEGDPETPEAKAARLKAEVDDRLRGDWNQYVDWLEKKGMKGSPSLDKGDMGNKMIDAYRKENPNSSVSRENVVAVQNEFKKYRQYSINELKNKKGQVKDPEGKVRFLEKDENPEWYLRALSNVDGLPGQRTTSYKFPSEYMTSFHNEQNLGTKNLGFNKAKN